MTFSLASGTIADGDRFLIRPVRSGAASIDMALSDPAKIAAASPIRAYTDLNNTGTATIDSSSVTDAGLFVNDTYNINMTSATTYEVRDSANTLITNGTYSSGSSITFNGIDVSISGDPQAGDVFVVEPNSNGIGDNSNALKLAALQLDDTLKGNTVSYQELYGQMVVDIGTKTNQAEINSKAQQGLLDQATAAREAKSGVNLDEEAANLVKYQQLYQASARIISVADTTFQSILSIFR
jgi:flagellar hook-associated protein 1 FlgK